MSIPTVKMGTVRGTNVTVHAVAAGRQLSRPRARQALLPLLSNAPQVQMIPKVLLKCANKEDKKEAKTFTIRNINPSVVNTCELL